METENAAPAGGAEAIDAPVIVGTPVETAINVSDAAKNLAKWREATAKKLAEPPAEEKPAEPPKELAEKPNSDPEEAPAETPEEAEPAELPPIEPPRSWTKEEKEEFLTYPREAQEKIARREQDRETALRRSQNEAADKLKGLTTKEQQLEQARQQYEQALPALLQTLQEQQLGEFSDVKSIADLKTLAVTDPVRFAQYQAKQMEIAAVQREAEQARERQAKDFEQKWSEFATKEDQLLLEKAPELADKTKAGQIGDKAVEILKDIGFSDQELAQLWNGKASLSLRDHRAQLLILDGVKYREAKAGADKKTKAAPPVPAVQKPGTAPQKGAENIAQIEKARENLSTARGINAVRAAAELYAAQKAARR